MMYFPWISYNHGIWRNIISNNGASSNHSVFPNCNARKYCRVGTN